MLQYGPTKITYNMRRILPYKSDNKFEDFILLNMSDDIKIYIIHR